MDDETRAYFEENRAYLDQALGGLRQEIGELRQEVRASTLEMALETRRHFDVVAEALRHDIRAVAEGVAATFERVDRLGSDLRTEMDQRFAATHAIVRVTFQEIRRDISDLRARP